MGPLEILCDRVESPQMSAADTTSTSRLRLGRIAASVPDSEEFAWRVLILLNVFRLTLGSLLLAVFLAVQDPRIIGGTNPTLPWGALVAMLVTGVIEIWLLRYRSPSSNRRCSDIVRATCVSNCPRSSGSAAVSGSASHARNTCSVAAGSSKSHRSSILAAISRLSAWLTRVS